MRSLLIRLFGSIILVTPQFALLADEIVTGGNVDALKAAIQAANEAGGELVQIGLQGDFEFSSNDLLPPITGSVTLWGDADNAILRGKAGDNGLDQLFLIERGGLLQFENLRISDFDLGSVRNGKPLIENHGDLNIWASSFTNIHGVLIQSTNPRFGGPRGEELIQNQGALQLDSSSFVDVGFRGGTGGLLVNMGTASMVNVFVSPSEQDLRGPIRNMGNLTLISVTMIGTNSAVGPLDYAVWNEGGTVRIGNSIFADFLSDWCTGIESLGHNLIEDGSCKFRVAGDITNQPSGLLPTSLESGPWGGPVAMRRLAASSLAVDSGHAELCTTYNHDALYTIRPVDGNNDGQAVCDRGAVEFVSNNLSSGGVTGLYYDPQSDGHYVQVLETTYNTMITWNTVDKDGNQAWVYGIGQLVGGQSLIAEAYINRGGRLTDQGPVDIEAAESWGTIQLEMDSCTSGWVIFSSVLPEFGEGMFSIQRLAYSRQIGCQD